MIPAISSTKVLSALDNEASLWPLLVKDLVDNTGRSVMEYKRGGQGAHHAGRERTIEEFATTAIWIGGRKAMNYTIIDPIMRSLGLDPKVDISLFLKKHGQPIPRWIATKRQAYISANIIRFLVGTLVPVFIIGWMIPPINQAITRMKQAQEKSPAQPYPMQNGTLRFGAAASPAMLEKMATLINNDFWGNVAIDAGISGGRLYRARNWVDFMEIAVRESSIVLFLYFLGDYVKGHLRRFFDKKQNTISDLTFDSIKWLKGQKITPTQWQTEMSFLQKLNSKNAFTTISGLLNPETGRFDKNPILELVRLQRKIKVLSANEPLPLDVFRNIFGSGIAQTNKKFVVDPRQLLDIQELKEMLIGTEKLQIQKLTGRTPKPVKIKEPGIVKQMLNNIKSAGSFQKNLARNLATTSKYKLIAMLASYAISTLCIAWLTPMFQHWLTYTLTGSVDFPGTRNSVSRLPLKKDAHQQSGTSNAAAATANGPFPVRHYPQQQMTRYSQMKLQQPQTRYYQ